MRDTRPESVTEDMPEREWFFIRLTDSENEHTTALTTGGSLAATIH